MRCHEIDYQIFGDDQQFVEIELDPNETVIAEAGAMLYMEDDIVFETKMGDGSDPDAGLFGKLLSVGRRAITGESIFMTHFSNRGMVKRRAAFAAPFPGKIVPLDLSTVNGDFICQKSSFLCAALGTKLGVALNKKIGAGLFGGEGFILQRLTGDGMIFVHAGGTVIEKRLDGGTLRVDTGCIVGFEGQGVEYSVARAGNLKSMLLGGEGIFLATLSGHGRVWLQSLPFSVLAERVLACAPSGETGGGKDQGTGSILGGIATMFKA
jgi:uncharacterized protein (TIGR00266 family)